MTSDELAGWLWPVLAATIVTAVAVWHFLRRQRLRSIFVSYRRADSAAQTSQLVALLGERFGPSGIFHDVASIRPGEDFRIVIQRALNRCDAALVVIGPDWAEGTDESGRPRLAAPDDIVRAEVSAALRSGALVVPVLVREAKLPGTEQLPPELRALLDRNAVAVPGFDDPSAVVRLVDAIRGAPMRRSAGFIALCHAAVLAQLVVFYIADGLTRPEFTTSLGIVTPAIAAVGAVDVMQRLGAPIAPARVARISPSALLWPLAFVAAISGLVVMKALNLGFNAFEPFKLSLGAAELAFAAYTGVVLASLQRNGGPQ